MVVLFAIVLVGYVAGYPFSPETVRRLQDEHTALLHTHCPVASAILARELENAIRLIRENKAAIDAMVERLLAENHLTAESIREIFEADAAGAR